jgi:hypothetical protein
MDIYIYYRVHQDHADLLHERVSYVQRILGAHDGVICELKRRPDPSEGYNTWMEVYLNTPAQFIERIESAIEQAGITPLINGERHVEYFMGANPCA